MFAVAYQHRMLYERGRIVRQYLMRIIVAGILCTLATVRFTNKDAVGRLIRLICCIFMTLTVIMPWRNISVSSLLELNEFSTDDMNIIINEGQNYSDNALRQVITQQCRTYIVEKAKGMGVSIDAEVVLSLESPPTPCAVTITGGVPPYTKVKLSEVLSQEMGIPKEQQIWK